MDQQFDRAARRAPHPRLLRRSLVLAALGAGLWLAGEATASAQELAPPLTAPGATSPDLTDAPAPRTELLAPATAAAAPVLPAAPVVHAVTVPIAELADPVVHSAEPVLDAVAPLRDVAAEVAEPLAGALDPPLGPAVDVIAPVLAADPIRSQQPQDAGHRLSEGVHGGAGDPARAAHRVAPALVVVHPAADPGWVGGTVPVPPPTPATGGPAPAWCTGAQSSDQTPADLWAAVESTITAALVAAGDAREAAGDPVSDPSFSPD